MPNRFPPKTAVGQPPRQGREPMPRAMLDDGLDGYLKFANDLLWSAYEGEISETRAARLIAATKTAAEIWAAREMLQPDQKMIEG